MKPSLLLSISLLAVMSAAHADIPLALNKFASQLSENFENYINESLTRRRQHDAARARIVPKGAKPEVIIRRTGIESSGNPYFADGILYNGQRITITDTPARAIEVFGPDFRVYQSRHIWDNLGISMHVATPSQSFNNKPKPKYIKSISIDLNPPPPGEPISPTEPSHYFSGHLDLDGAGIDSKTKIWEVRALADRSGLSGGHPYIICIQSRTVCEVQSLGDERSDEVSFWTDKDHANGKIYSVTYMYEGHDRFRRDEQNRIIK
ncbi:MULTISPECIES: hypothetical protein [Pseudomonas]|uniref:DUF7738 domain-containing protein n=1 Tax=Pseudomonas TaxID=286 RepID=UPI0011B1C7F2|nr:MULTISPECIES: hypothetical protein [Pseudomonas]